MAKTKTRIDESLSKGNLEKIKNGTTNKEIDTSELKVVEGNVLPKDDKEDLKKEEIKKPKKIDIEKYEYTIDSFIENSKNVKKRVGGGSGVAFKVWYQLSQGKSLHNRKTTKDWEGLFNKFMNQPTR